MTSNTGIPALAVVDWGTTNFRAYLVDSVGNCIDRVINEGGVLAIDGAFHRVLQEFIGHWLEPKVSIPILLSGMVSGRNGWVELPYVECPLNAKTLAKNLRQMNSFNSGKCWLVPGVSSTGASACFDVMRGEEIQYLGARLLAEKRRSPLPDFICMPGTHNKWVVSSAGEMISFSTAMTGEIYSLLGRTSLLSKSVASGGSWSEKAFEEGLSCSGRPGGLLHQLFTVRSLHLSGEHLLEQGEPYLSGLLIGNEIRSMLPSGEAVVAVVASDSLMEKYLHALHYFGHTAYGINSEQATIAGAWEIARHVNDFSHEDRE